MTESESLDDTLRSLRLVLEQLTGANKEVDPRRHFYKMFNREADEYDRDFHKKYHDDLNTTLIFAGLFSAVASAFIIDIQQELRPDYNEMSFTVLTMLLNATSGVPNQLNVPVASGPKASAVEVQSILFGSLASALLAAFLAMLGKQWLNLHVEGSLIDRSRHRELRMRGMITWRFKIIMECLPLIMQLSLLLLGYALARYLWDLSRTVSAVIAAFTIFGLLFYLSIVFAATVWKTCPFQTPVSVVLRYVLTLVKQKNYERLQEIRDRLPTAAQFRKVNESYLTVTLARSINEDIPSSPQSLSRTLTPGTTITNLEDDESTQASDVNCISTMFRFAGAPDAIVAVTGFIPEVNWTSSVRRVPLLEVYDCLCRSFEFLKDGRVFIRPGMRDQAYGSARALLHLRVQRPRAKFTDNAGIFASKIGSLPGYRSREDQELEPTLHHELESTLQVLDVVFNKEKEIQWQEFTLGDAHYCWLSHVLRCRAWVTLRTRETPTKEVIGFVQHAFSKKPLPPPRVIADCLLIVDMIVGGPPRKDDRMLIKDKSEEIEITIRKIYRNLQLAVSPRSSDSRRRCTLEALGLLMHLEQETLHFESYRLFLRIMETVDSDRWFWYPAELSLIGAFNWKVTRPHLGDPESLVRFLAHCLSEQERGAVMDLPVERIMLALASAPTEVVGAGIMKVDFTEPLFFNGICHALRNGAPYLLRRAAVTFLRHLDMQFFNANKIFSKNQIDKFVPVWSSSAQESLEKERGRFLAEALFGTLVGMLDSPSWREHIPDGRWGILALLGGMDEEQIPPSFYRCVKNSTIIPHLKQISVRGPDVLAQWVAILWAMYPDLSGDVKSQLEAATKDIANGPSKHNLSSYSAIVDGQIERIWAKISSHTQSWSLGGDVAKLRQRHAALRLARGALIGIQKLPL